MADEVTATNLVARESQQAALAVITNAIKAPWDKHGKELEALRGLVPAVLETPSQEADAADLGKLAKQWLDNVEDVRDAHVRPLNDTVKQINDTCRPYSTAAKALYDDMRKRLGDAALVRKRAEEKAALEAFDAAAKEATGGEVQLSSGEGIAPREIVAAALAQEPTLQRSPESFGKSTTGWKWHWTVTDPKAVPREFLCIDEEMLNLKARAKPSPPEIPGVVWNQVPSTRIR